MYADRSRGSRSVSFGMALLVNGALVGGLMLAAPQVIPRATERALEARHIPLAPDPEPIEPVEVEPSRELPRETSVVVPTPLADTVVTPVEIATTTVIPDSAPVAGPAIPDGTGTAPLTLPADPPRPAPPLVAASVDPRHADAYQPRYPATELRREREGSVTVRVRIGTDGRVSEVQRIAATSDAFFEATRQQALGRWRFRPATRGGVAEESWKRMVVRFEIPR